MLARLVVAAVLAWALVVVSALTPTLSQRGEGEVGSQHPALSTRLGVTNEH